jgi:hypothetical protein
MDIRAVRKRYESAYVEDFGDYEIVHVDKVELDCLITIIERYEKALREIAEETGTPYAEIALKALEGK